jgi:hypothetical protein
MALAMHLNRSVSQSTGDEFPRPDCLTKDPGSQVITHFATQMTE